MEIGVKEIDFLGMKITDRKFQHQPHIAQELKRFPDKLTSQKEIQQFLGLVSYMGESLPKLSSQTVHLFPMLKRNPPQWTEKQTQAVNEIKRLADVRPPLKISTPTDKRILQTDASDEYWAAVLIAEDNKGVRNDKHLEEAKQRKNLAYPRFLQIIFYRVLEYLPTTGTTHVPQNPNVYKRNAKLSTTSWFNPRTEFDILPWRVNHDVAIMLVPELSSEEEEEDEVKDDDSDENDDGGADDVDLGDGVVGSIA
ncbi:uncharacterized protein LOC143594750 [Bidens hawaiensis]|uniref:uncharacterized protein LOC143594750 n=1 Tax=Bidens hawaiensis TaxID=980011 RepID=UPI0040490B89